MRSSLVGPSQWACKAPRRPQSLNPDPASLAKDPRTDAGAEDPSRRQPTRAKQLTREKFLMNDIVARFTLFNQPLYVRTRRKSFWIALGLLMAWLVLVGSLTWMRSRESVLPPLWDQQTYVEKAEAVWTSISKGTRENPLSIEPSVRPPGTVLLTAPLGPLKDFRNFYFRSAFIPVVIMALSVFIVGVGVTRQPWESALLALLAASMPMFWQFDYGGPSYYWGLVDTFLAGLGALAMAGLLAGSVGFKPIWFVPAIIALALLPLVKPTGFLMGGMIALAWLAVAVRFARLHPGGRIRGWLGIASTAFAIVLVLGGVALLSFGSNYFSSSNIEFGKVALAQLRAEWYRNYTTNGLTDLFSASIGVPLLSAFGLLGAIALLRRKRGIDVELAQKAQWMAVIGIVFVFAGVAVTYQATMFRQARYFFPVTAVALILFVPTLVLWGQRAGKLICTGLGVIPIALLTFLFSPKLNGLAYSIGGYGLATGYGREEVSAANAFIDKFLAANAHSPSLFATDIGLASYAFETAFLNRLRKVGFSELQVAQSVTRPFSWERDGMVTINSIYNADVLAIERRSLRPLAMQPMTFYEELQAWKAWLEVTSETGSTEILMKSPTLLVLAIRDRALLERQMRQHLYSRPWRPEFRAANGPTEFAPEEVAALRLGDLQLAQPVDFGDAFRVHALSMSTLSGESKISVDVFSEYLGKNASRRFFFFIHQLDRNGKIISNHEVELPSSRFANRPVSRSRYAFMRLPKTAQLGVGVYESGGSALVTDWTLANDWGGRRAKISILTLPVSIDSEDSP